MPKHLCIILFLICNTILVRGQKDSLHLKYDTIVLHKLSIEDGELDLFKEDPKFDYEVAKNEVPEWWIAFKNWIGNIFLRVFEWLFGVERAAGAFHTFLQILPYVLVVILLFILIKFFLNVNARAIVHAQKNSSAVTLSDEEHIIKNEDIQELISKALSNKNYRLAVRYYYLYMLQLMSKKELIDWQLQKTNDDYIKEIKNKELKTSFVTITRLYDYIWYGDFPIDEGNYIKVESSFKSLQNLLPHA
ncbi:DUF4129 domain-containing protein [Maribacter sp. 2304DJ31-5]|uniref:DUF4129 domain-containing protein n=1 Tax=Maribacter sp. 2304DJ31-5 TaxID=3386273 RepID=UPI0039BD7526